MSVKNKQEAYEKIMSIGKNNDCTTGNLLDYEYFSKHYELIAIDLSKQIQLENPDLRQQIDFIGKLEDDKAPMSLSDCNWTRTQNHLVLKRTLNHFGQMVEWSFKN